MSSITIHPPKPDQKPETSNPLPTLLQTPSGLAILELQGSINLPQDSDGKTLPDTQIGRLEFPDYDPANAGNSDWMKRVHMYVGQHQRLTGEVKKLPRSIAVVRRRENKMVEGSGGKRMEEGENLEMLEIVQYKIMFGNRPEPVGTANAS
ncbi:hypothetical protein K4F52_009531 [Lecanicillium sp. MT-2017a]|nr:hypothetical protein K4F52_009531 [Lecanicillium sp. MT-2017a]